MNELQKKIIEYAERYWHSKLGLVLALAVEVVAVLGFFYSAMTRTVPPIGWITLAIVLLTTAVVWFVTNRLARIPKGVVGVVLAIACEDAEHAKQVRVDFVEKLKTLFRFGNTHFQVVELPSYWVRDLSDIERIRKLFYRTRGHFMLYGRVRKRNVEGREAHLLDFEGLVRHLPVPAELQQDLQVDFTKVLPRRVIIERENDAFSFQVTSEWTDVATRYMVGMAAFISGDVSYAEALFTEVEAKLGRANSRLIPLQDIARRLPDRFMQLYLAWLTHLSRRYFLTRGIEYIKKTDEIASKIIARDPRQHNALLMKAICEFLLRKDVPAAHRLITRARNATNATWWYSRAFLHAYDGKMDNAIHDYKKAFSGSVPDVTVPIQCEEFIQIVLNDEPQRVQLHFFLGLINLYAKRDYAAAKSDFETFVQRAAADPRLSKYIAEAREMIAKCELSAELELPFDG